MSYGTVASVRQRRRHPRWPSVMRRRDYAWMSVRLSASPTALSAGVPGWRAPEGRAEVIVTGDDSHGEAAEVNRAQHTRNEQSA